MIFPPNEGEAYRVFCDASFLGTITPVMNEDKVLIWKTAYNILKPIAAKIGAHIESH